MPIEVSAIIVGMAIGGLFSFYLLKSGKDTATIEAEFKKVILSLFLYAEKQGWDNEKKMSYVVHKIEDFIPGETIKQLVAGKHLTEYLESVYHEMKKMLEK